MLFQIFPLLHIQVVLQLWHGNTTSKGCSMLNSTFIKSRVLPCVTLSCASMSAIELRDIAVLMHTWICRTSYRILC